jgi:hypothetical protein
MIRFADISGSLEEEGNVGAFVEEVADPGIGLYLMTVGWILVAVAGFISTSKRQAAAAPGSF